jgi:hypothetical protein
MIPRLCRSIVFALLVASTAAAQEESIVVFESAAIEYDPAGPESASRDGYEARDHGRTIEALVKLPDRPHNLRDQQQIILHLEVVPALIEDAAGARIADPWTRVGSVSIVIPPSGDQPAEPATAELMRFMTGFGGETTFEEDITPFAPLLGGDSRFRTRISTYLKPGWHVTMRLEYRTGSAGYRRPMLALPIAAEESLTAEEPAITRRVEIPPDLAMPRLRVLSTGHGARQEFIAAKHSLRIDGVEVARWRPWREDAGDLHEVNPTSHREDIDGRTLWSSDIDRAGWIPGARVEPLTIPLPELTPGPHTIEIVIEGIQPAAAAGGSGGYWLVSATLCVDERWPRQ